MSFPAKRKPEEQIRRPVDKLQKTGALAANSSRPLTQTQKPSAVDAHMAKMRLGTNSSKSSNGGNITAISFKNRRSTPPPNPGPPKAPPKKGSFAEIMARGKVAQASLGQVGKISHKKIEKLPSKREREEMKSQKSLKLQKNLGPNGKFKAAGQEIMQNTRNGSTLSVKAGKQGKKSVEPPPEKKVKKAALATTGYAGTARPKPGSAKGSSKSAASSSSRYDRGPDRYREDRRGSSGARYAYVSEDEDEEEEDDDDGDEEDEQDYDSESDMEAAVFEVDEEEELAARIARKEDAEALAEENRHKREKEEKRKRLAAMARSRR
jgi:protein SPT2